MNIEYYLEVSSELELVEDLETLRAKHPSKELIAYPLDSRVEKGVELDLYGVSFI